MPSRLAMADWLSPDRFLASAIARLMVRSAFTRILSSMSLTVSKVCFAVDSDDCRVESCSLFIAVNYITHDMPRSKMQALRGYITQECAELREGERPREPQRIVNYKNCKTVQLAKL